mgnify:CR=1 FL=1
MVTIELVDEGNEQANERIAEELLAWFRMDAISIPWAKAVRDIVIEENQML